MWKLKQVKYTTKFKNNVILGFGKLLITGKKVFSDKTSNKMIFIQTIYR